MYATEDEMLYMGGWQPPFTMWKGFAEYREMPLEEALELCGMEGRDVDEHDSLEDIEVTELPELSGFHRRTATGAVFDLFQDRGVSGGTFESPGLDVNLGSIECTEGIRPGDNFTYVSTSSPIALSCLQYASDRMGAGIRIEWLGSDFDRLNALLSAR